MTALDRIDYGDLSRTLAEMDADGWLIFDFHGVNPVATRVAEFRGMVTRRLFIWLPASGTPLSIVHTIDVGAFGKLPGELRPYTTWQELNDLLADTLSGKRVAMEVSARNSVPYLDRVPAGVVELLTSFGVTVIPSDRLVTRFASRWSDAELEAHRLTAEILARIARDTLAGVVTEAGKVTEFEVQQRVLAAMTAAGLSTEDPPIVAFGANAANPHHSPREADSRALKSGEVVLLDLWGFPAGGGWADQTWMAFAGDTPPDDLQSVWEAVKDARDSVVSLLRDAQSQGAELTGADLDDVARNVLRDRGFGDAFGHRTGHSIDGDLHGSGPHLDNFETHDVRVLVPGIVFSVEPGVYLTGRFGVRSEINVVLTDGGPEVTPRQPQSEIILP